MRIVIWVLIGLGGYALCLKVLWMTAVAQFPKLLLMYVGAGLFFLAIAKIGSHLPE